MRQFQNADQLVLLIVRLASRIKISVSRGSFQGGVLAQALLGLELVPRPNGPNSTRKPCAKMISRDIAKRSIRTAVSRYLMNSKLQAYVAP